MAAHLKVKRTIFGKGNNVIDPLNQHKIILFFFLFFQKKGGETN